MDKLTAIYLIKQIQNGNFDRNEPFVRKGRIAEKLWDDDKFTLGMEYGAMVGLMQIFDISDDDLDCFRVADVTTSDKGVSYPLKKNTEFID